MLPTDRPAELIALLAIASALYGWLAERGVPAVAAALIGLAAGAVPLALSTIRDMLPAADDASPVDHPPAPAIKKHERHQLDHQELDAA